MAAQRAITGAAKKTTAKRPAKKTTAAKKTAAKKAAPPQATAGIDEPGNSLMMIRIGGHEYPQVTSKNCRTCQSPHRRWIENEVLRARSYRSIAQRLEDLPEGHLPHPSFQGIADHVSSAHMPSVSRVRREIVDREAKRLGDAFAEGESLVTHRVVNEQLIQRGYERLVSGEIDVSTSDLLQAIGAQQRIEAGMSSEGFEIEAMQQALLVYLELAQEFIPRERMAEYGARISRHPVIRALAARSAAKNDSETVQQTG